MSGEVVLYDYWRSSAAYRVRIALNLKGIAYRAVPVDLSAGAQSDPGHLGLNPQGLVPALEIDGRATDKYGRALRIVTRDGQSIGQQLVDEGLARTWDGRRHPWC